MTTLNTRPNPDQLFIDIANYVMQPPDLSQLAYDTARLCFMDALGCAIAALRFPACTKLLGPLVLGTTVPNGAHIPGTDYQLDPVAAAFNLGAMIRWLDYNDTWLAAEWGHPSDNLGAILTTADWLNRSAALSAGKVFKVRDVLAGMIEAYEIQGILALNNSLNRVGIDHVLFVRVACAAVTARLMGAGPDEIINAVSNAFIDAGPMRTYRHAPNTGSRKSWAAGDAASRGVFHAVLARRGEMGYPSALSAKIWGFSDVVMNGQPLTLARPFGSYVMENILFKVSFPAEFHAQTAVEAAFQLHPLVEGRLDEIERVVITTQESAMRIINKSGPLYNPADRDHTIQYMTAIGLIFGDLTAEHYEDAVAADPRIDALRAKMTCVEDPQYSRDYLDPDKRSIPNAVQVFFKDGTSTEKVEVHFPIGHRRRRVEATPLLFEKFRENLSGHFPAGQVESLVDLFRRPHELDELPAHELVDLFMLA